MSQGIEAVHHTDQVILNDPLSSSSARPAGVFAAMARKLRKLGPLFWFVVLLPTAISTVYFGILVSDVYISESRFVVRSPDRPARTGLGVVLASAGFSTASDEVRAAQGYIQSRDALQSLDRDGFARRAWSAPSISIFNRFDPMGWSGSFEELYRYYEEKVAIKFDSETGITTLTVKAFDPQASQQINRRLLEQAEGLVNQLNDRGQSDMVRNAQREVDEAQVQSRAAAEALAAYRNQVGVIDPERQATVQLQMISKLQDELIGARMQLLQMSAIGGQNPQIPTLRLRIDGLKKAIDEQLGEVAGNSRSLSATAVKFQRLQLQREFSDKQLGASLAALQDAKNEARRQRAYVERIAEPSKPDKAMEPRRLRGVLATLVVSLVAWAILVMLLAGVREHRA
ncbi:MAG: hypothetical protein NTX28_10800 [Novosphingobium sp.]|nr:hypothetical protein [Novosphingobium sp.]